MKRSYLSSILLSNNTFKTNKFKQFYNFNLKLLSFKTSSNEKMNNYIYEVGNRISDLKKKLREETQKDYSKDAIMLTELAEGELLKMLVKITNSKRVIELGVFTGYSSLCLAEGLPEDGKIYASDISKEFTDVARKYWKLANLDDKIELYLENGICFLDKIANKKESIDFAYIDADKINYDIYFEKTLAILKTGGIIVFDNTLYSGKVFEEDESKLCENSKALKKLNQKLYNDKRVDINMLPFSDGITIVRKI